MDTLLSQNLSSLMIPWMYLRHVMGLKVSTNVAMGLIITKCNPLDSESHVNGSAPMVTNDETKLTRNTVPPSSSGSAAGGMNNKIQPMAGIPGAVATCLVGMSKFHVPSPTNPNLNHSTTSQSSNTPPAPFIRRGSKTEMCLSKQTEQERVVRGKDDD